MIQINCVVTFGISVNCVASLVSCDDDRLALVCTVLYCDNGKLA